MAKLILITALIWAVIILYASHLFHDAENYNKLFTALLVAAGFHNGLIYNYCKGNDKK